MKLIIDNEVSSTCVMKVMNENMNDADASDNLDNTKEHFEKRLSKAQSSDYMQMFIEVGIGVLSVCVIMIIIVVRVLKSNQHQILSKS